MEQNFVAFFFLNAMQLFLEERFALSGSEN